MTAWRDGGGQFWDLPSEAWYGGAGVHLATAGGARPWACAHPKGPMVVVLADLRQMETFAEDWKALDPEKSGGTLSVLRELPLGPEAAGNRAYWMQRGETLRRWRHRGGVLVATPGGLLGPYEEGTETLSLREGEVVGWNRLLAWLTEGGYGRSDLVWAPGQWVSRGGIVDVFDPAEPLPLRIEFCDDEISSIRYFSPENQRSVGSLGTVELRRLSDSRSLRRGIAAERIPEDVPVVFFEPRDVELQGDLYEELWNGLREQEDLPEIPPWQEVALSLFRHPRLRVSRALAPGDHRMAIQELPPFRGKIKDAEGFVAAWRDRGFSLLLVSRTEAVRLWGEQRGFHVRSGSLSGGFLDLDSRCGVFSDAELVGVSLSSPSSGWYGVPREWADRLAPQSWVVHEDYGVSRFLGTQGVETPQGEQDYLVLEFAQGKRLLVPVAQFGKVTPFSALPEEEPTPDALSGSRWRKAVQRARERAAEAAKKLANLYALRETTAGMAFPADGEMLRMVEHSFPYRETEDQLRAIRDVKKDMEHHYPMDRLVVGDVGFGKTEVALRAVLKAVEGGRQAAFLVPTTILAQQHHGTFEGRLAGLPLRVESISRFVSPARQRRILADTAEGKVDLLIGTHRLLQKDVSFARLGLLVVDEEHRFGVLSKEEIKGRFPGVDVLTLTATPIPRTLQLALGGMRPLSLISTPPEHRFPVLSVVSPWRDDLVRKALQRELARGGQAFFVHNRIPQLESRERWLREALPGSRVAVAHGSLPSEGLERVMEDFFLGKSDILLCTTIVESGLDVPQANTLIVDDAQHLGLAQMYQLRGRIGRRSAQAFAYFLYPEGETLSREAQERLEAIGEMGEFGSGYRLAMRDLEIRGGGDFLGLAQHGHGPRVGFSLYCSLLEKELTVAMGGKISKTAIAINFPLGIPRGYVGEESVRIALYRRILRLDSWEEVQSIERELRDRFGPIPESVGTLLDGARIRALGSHFGVEYVDGRVDRTEVGGEALGRSPLGRALPGWMPGKRGLVGPGGARGLRDLAEALKILSEASEGTKS